MTLFLFIKQAISSIWANKLRSFLSTLWIVIGISSFVIMLAIWEWAKQSMLEGIWNNWNIIKVSQNFRSEDSSWKNIFTEALAKEIEKKVPLIKKVIINYSAPNWEATYDSQYVYWSIKPISNDYFAFKSLEIEYGSNFSKDDFKNWEKFVIIWNAFIKKADSFMWWGDSPMTWTIPIWKKINIAWENFIILWILKEKNWEFDNNLFITDTTYKRIFNDNSISWFEVSAIDEENVEKAQEYLNYFLFKKSWVKTWEDLPFETRTDKEMLKQFNEMSAKFSLLLAWIWAIALIVWGIWIMNIMVVSVTERTREIGIRKAIWATNKNIMFQFLIESIILTLLGSVIAVWVSWWVVTVIWNFFPEFQPVINSYVLLIAIIVSVSMWIIFWLMPAWKAAKLKPIDALHFE